MALLFLFLMALAIFAGLWWRARPGAPGRMLILATLLAAAAGYVWQGSPFLRGSPTAPRANHPNADPLFARERLVWLGRVGPEADLLASADMLIGQDSADYAVGILRGALSRTPNNMDLWIGLGNALATYADGSVTPAARYCFERAAALAPHHPAPRFFLGLAYLGAGDLDQTERLWRAALADLPPGAPTRKLLQDRLALLARLRAALTARSGGVEGGAPPRL